MKSCACGHGKTIHHRSGALFSIAPPNPCNFPKCGCPNYSPKQTEQPL